MHNYTVINDATGKIYKRVRKDRARAAYLAGKTILLCPCKMRPFSMWYSACPIIPRDVSRDDSYINDADALRNFEIEINHFEYYNCRDAQTGKYTAFYEEV